MILQIACEKVGQRQSPHSKKASVLIELGLFYFVLRRFLVVLNQSQAISVRIRLRGGPKR